MGGSRGGHTGGVRQRTAETAQETVSSRGPQTKPGAGISLQRRAGNQAVARLLQGAGQAAAMAVVAAAVQRPGAELDPLIRQDFEHRLGHDLSAVRVHAGGEATRAAAAVGAGAYTLGRHIVIREGLDDPWTPEGHHLLAHELTHAVQQAAFADHQLAGAPALGPDHLSEQQARAGTGAVTPLDAPAVQRGPLDIVTSRQHITIDLSARAWRKSAVFQGGQSQVVYVLNDATTGEILKVGKTTVDSMTGRFGQYVTAGNKWGRKLTVDVYTMRKRPGRTVQVFEKEMRAGLEKMGHRLPWDNTDGRLGREGGGIPEPKPLSESSAELKWINEAEKELHAAPVPVSVEMKPPASPETDPVAPVPEQSAENAAASGAEHSAESTATHTLEREVERGPSMLGKAVRFGPLLVKDLVIGYLSNKVAMDIVHGSKFEEEWEVLNRANGVPTVPTKDEESGDTLLSFIPPGYDIAAALASRLVQDVMYGMVTQDAARRAEKFRQDYPDAPPGEYEALQKRADDIYNGLVDY
jgi:hypothetical protein